MEFLGMELSDIADIIGIIADLKELISGLGGAAGTAIGPVMGLSSSLIPIAIIAASVAVSLVALTILFDQIVNAISDVVEAIGGFIEESGGLGSIINEVWTAISTTISEVIDGIIAIFEMFFGTVENIVNQITETIGGIVESITGVFNNIVTSITEIINNVINVIQSVINFITGVFMTAWGSAWDSVKEIFKSIVDSLYGVFKGVWDKIIGIFSAGGKIFQGIAEGIGNIFKNVVGGIIDGINTVIALPFKTINGLLNDIRLFDIPLVGKPFKGLWGKNPLPIPKIPQLAKGGVLTQGIAMVGEAGPELLLQQGNRTTVAPLSRGGGADPVNIIDYDKLANIIVNAFVGASNGITVEMDRREFGKLVSEVTR